MKTRIEDVLNAIQDERKYQDMMLFSTESTKFIKMNMGDILLAMEHNLSKARETWYDESKPYTETMDYCRKVAALAVKAGEDYGMPTR